MFSSPTLGSPFARRHASTGVYRQVGVETGVASASAHRLVQMLFDGFVDAVAQAKGALANGQIELKCRAVSRAARIVDEGLKANLDISSGGALAADLTDLYAYVTLRLTQANLRNDTQALDECLALMQPLREAWASIASQVSATA
jgi:flagellar secretion chaperone FliS